MNEESVGIDKSGYEEYHAPSERKNMHQNEEQANPGDEERADPDDGDFLFIRRVCFLIIMAAIVYVLLLILDSPLFTPQGQGTL